MWDTKICAILILHVCNENYGHIANVQLISVGERVQTSCPGITTDAPQVSWKTSHESSHPDWDSNPRG